MTFGGLNYWKRIGTTDQSEANNLVDISIEHGINFFDTADVYSNGLAEEILGNAIYGKRQNLIVATKVFGRMGDGPKDIGLTRKHIL